MASSQKTQHFAPVDGGWGWMIVIACFFVTVCTRAVTRCISVFFVEFQSHFTEDYTRTAWIHSIVDSATMLCAPLGSFIGNRLSCRVVIIMGGVFASTGLILSSFATSLEYLYLTLGILTGLGFALCYTPAVAMVGKYFYRRKALAYGIAMSGSGIGTFILAPVVQFLIDQYSWRGALLILGGIVFNLCVCGALMRPITVTKDFIKSPELSEEELICKAQEKDSEEVSKFNKCSCCPSRTEYSFLLMPDFLLLAVSFLFLAYGCSPPFVYLVPYAISVGINHQEATFLMSILGIINIIGNITFGWLTDRRFLKKFRIFCYLLAVGMDGLSCLIIPVLRTFSLLVPFSVTFGYFDGAYVALMPVITADVVGVTQLSSALGVVYFLHAIPYLVSPPIAGLLVDSTGSYTAAFLISGASMIFSSSLLLFGNLVKKLRKKQEGPLPAESNPKLQIWNNSTVPYIVAGETDQKAV
ncbi:monocarboxylate transporter 12 [Protopterus annectens]|uniref:monocarboxylate transporter 12 n=1 Tax=Protopterus annectens TaxID=7888 RepID=UPI001CF9F632|nr:monocarboxylate transporter 12 [Protopterus annectens]